MNWEGKTMKKILVLIIGIFIIAGITLGCTAVEPYRFELLNLNMGTESHGSFFLGIGSIDSEATYYFYTKDNDGGIQLRKAIPEEVTIYQDGGKYAEGYAYDNNGNGTIDKNEKDFFLRWSLHIPEKSVTEYWELKPE